MSVEQHSDLFGAVGKASQRCERASIGRNPRALRRALACAATLILALAMAGSAVAQTAPSKDYYEICRNLGYFPGTRPMRSCIEAKRSNDLDPMNALVEHELIPPAQTKSQITVQDSEADFSGAQTPKLDPDRTPEELLLGPDFRAPFQNIYE